MSVTTKLPRVTFLLLSFNQERFIESAICGALGQDYENLEIIISDDRSTDQTWLLIRQYVQNYGGLHTLKVRRNLENLGLCGHINAALRESSGELIVLAAGDDVSAPSRVSVTVQYWLSRGKQPDSLWTSVELIDYNGSNLGHWNAGMSKYGLFGKTRKMVPELLGCSHAFTRRSYDLFGELDPELAYEDRVLAFRSLLLGGLLPIDEPLVQYRVHSESISAKEGPAHTGRPSAELLRRKLCVFRSYMRDLKYAKNRVSTFKYVSLVSYIYIQVLKLQMKLVLAKSA